MKKQSKKNDGPFLLALMAEEALKVAVYEAIKDHERTGDRVAIWRKGRAVLVDPKTLKLAKPAIKYARKENQS